MLDAIGRGGLSLYFNHIYLRWDRASAITDYIIRHNGGLLEVQQVSVVPVVVEETAERIHVTTWGH